MAELSATARVHDDSDKTRRRPRGRRSGSGRAATIAVRGKVPGYPRLPPYVVRLRDQKICSYCKHTIDEDPYFRNRGVWVRFLQNRSYWLRYAVLEITGALALALGKWWPVGYGLLMHFREHIMLPGWVRCANHECGQLYHATCWYQLKAGRGCFRCRSKRASRVT